MGPTPSLSGDGSPSKRPKRQIGHLSVAEKVKVLDKLKEGHGPSAVGRMFGLCESTVRSFRRREENIRKLFQSMAATSSNGMDHLESQTDMMQSNGLQSTRIKTHPTPKRGKIQKKPQPKLFCHLCRSLISSKNEMKWMDRSSCLPSSLKLPALLDNIGVAVSIPDNYDQMAVCNECVDLIREADLAYLQLQAVVEHMNDMWPQHPTHTDQPLSSQSTLPEPDTAATTTTTTEFVPILPKPEPMELGPEDETHSKMNFRSTRRIKSHSKIPDVCVCGLCGSEYSLITEWRSHMNDNHQIAEKWQGAYHLQKNLKSRLAEELENIGESTQQCSGCGQDFSNHSDLVIHLQEYHNVVIDEDFITDLCKETAKKNHTHIKQEINEEDQLEEIARQSVEGREEETYEKESVPNTDNSCWCCHVCGQYFKLKKDLRQHRQMKHPTMAAQMKNLRLYEGTQGNEEMEMQQKQGNSEGNDGLDTESNEMSTLLRLACDVCGRRRLLGLKYLRLHMAKAHNLPYNSNSRNYWCHLCMFASRLEKDLNHHLRTKHNVDPSPKVTCHICGKQFVKAYIESHIQNMHEIGSHICKVCGMKFTSKRPLAKHTYEEHRQNEWRCHVCHQVFDKYHRLRQHRIYNHSTKEHPCPSCNKTFKRMGDLTTHIQRRHTERVRHECSYCSATFAFRKALRYHLINKHNVPYEETLSKRFARQKRANHALPYQSKLYSNSQDSHGAKKMEIETMETRVGSEVVVAQRVPDGFNMVEVTEAENIHSLDDINYIILEAGEQ